jgi:hypothetical protein
MQLKGFLKRVGPFFLTFALGLLVASFFVAVGAPNFNKFRRNGDGHRCRHYKENYRLRMENESLRQDNESLRRRLTETEIKTVYIKPDFDSDLAVPPPPPMPVAPGIRR